MKSDTAVEQKETADSLLSRITDVRITDNIEELIIAGIPRFGKYRHVIAEINYKEISLRLLEYQAFPGSRGRLRFDEQAETIMGYVSTALQVSAARYSNSVITATKALT